MLNNEYEETLKMIKHNDPASYEILHSHLITLEREISNASHTIQNMISFINCSYQFISEVHPETNSFEYWSDISNSLGQLIEYTNRTSSYRYSFNEPEFVDVNISQLLHSLVTSLEDLEEAANSSRYELYQRQWNYYLDPSLTIIHTDKYQLKAALLELVKNGLEATPISLPITISAKQCPDHSVAISISYISNNMDILKDHVLSDLESPFFTTKPDHAGLGLSIVNNICQKLQATYTLSFSENHVTNTIVLPPPSALGN